jgi:hypothetical protein
MWFARVLGGGDLGCWCIVYLNCVWSECVWFYWLVELYVLVDVADDLTYLVLIGCNPSCAKVLYCIII